MQRIYTTEDAEMGWLLLMLIGALSALLIYAMLAPEKF
ncbi:MULTISPECIES: potassium-transporting ATPase subunit F [Rheinheimera]|nr:MULTISPECIES: potassium-transporting ATPase subunit F [Rheinheimera]HJS13946.1 potassium-transporting ATPase subunit F [Rheinheimera sp.]